MSSTVSLPKRIAKVFSDDSSYAFDLISHLTYMTALSMARTTRDTLLTLSTQLPYKTREQFARVQGMVHRLGFEYARAFQLVANATGVEAVKNLLLRFAGSILTGGNEAFFLQQESVVAMERYVSQYERAVEGLRKWTDAYSALLVSAALVVVVGQISTLMYAINAVFMAFLGAGMIGMVIMGVYVIARSAPIETKTFDQSGGPALRRASLRLLWLGLPAGLLVGAWSARSHGMGAFTLIIGISMLPAGVLAFMDDRRVDAMDKDLPNLVRTMGALTASLSTTLPRAMDKLDRKALGALERPIRALLARLHFRLKDQDCWERFHEDTGSQLVFRTTRSLVDAIKLGGPADKIGELCSTYALQNVLLRSKRQLAAETFTYLSIPLHATMVSLLLFVLQIMLNFTTLISGLMKDLEKQSGGTGISMSDLPMFQVHDMSAPKLMTYSLIVALTVANALAPKAASGGHWLKSFFFLAITCIMTGICMLTIPQVTSALFKMGN